MFYRVQNYTIVQYFFLSKNIKIYWFLFLFYVSFAVQFFFCHYSCSTFINNPSSDDVSEQIDIHRVKLVLVLTILFISMIVHLFKNVVHSQQLYKKLSRALVNNDMSLVITIVWKKKKNALLLLWDWHIHKYTKTKKIKFEQTTLFFFFFL